MTDTIAAIWPDSVWCGKGDAEYMRVRIVDLRRDGRVVIERIAGAPDHALRRELTVEEAQLRQAFVPTPDWDFGAP